MKLVYVNICYEMKFGIVYAEIRDTLIVESRGKRVARVVVRDIFRNGRPRDG